jgi:hypothetical protein
MKRLAVVLMVLSACSRGPETKKDMGVANSDSGGSVLDCDFGDDCLDQSCQACVDDCGSDCESQDIYPMEYSCPDGGHWTVFDVCPDWEQSDTGE